LTCLEYELKPGEIKMELRLYINDEVQVHEPDVMVIAQIMSTIVTFDRRIEEMREEAAA
jgi:hypothetical protein